MAGNMVGRILNNRYKITERVGLGGMAEVYRAQDSVLGRTVAVKVMLPQYAADPTFTQRFRQEAASAAALQSPYIVSIYDWGLDDDTYYIVMEFLRGTDLKTAISERGAINQRKVAEIGSQVAQALSVAHQANIIHRDIKPQNIMIQPDGNIKVMDFGIARAGDAGLSQTSTVLGTAHYVSPEQAQGKELTGASDIYSLGVVLYEAATGKLPFEGADSVSVAVKQVNELPVPPRAINPDIDPALEAIIMAALEKNPANRFRDAAEMRRALNDFLAGRPVQIPAGAQATQVMDRGVSSAETHVMSGIPTGGATRAMNTVGGMGTMGTDPTMMQAKRITEDLPDDKSRKGPGMIIGIIVAVLAVIAIAAGVMALANQGETITVPNVSGKELTQAENDLRAAGFEIGTVTEVYNADVAAGKVVSTSPSSGQKAKKGETINISVSKGNEQITVPDLKGMTRDQAMSSLSNAGLTGKEGETVFSDDVAENAVAAQDVSAGTPVAKSTTVVFHLSKGAETVAVPDVTDMTESKATSTLKTAGFEVSVKNSSSSSVAKGTVISQSPTGKAKKGSVVTITVSTGAESASVPDVTGMTESKATSTLENAGFKTATKYASSSSVKQGVVISQSVTGSATKGSTVTITVSSGSSSDSSSSGSGAAN